MITIGAHVKKAKRPEAYDLICCLKEGLELSPDQIDSLLLFFAPGRAGKPKTAMDWLADACSDDKRDHEVKRYIHVEGRRGIATDGHRVHEAHVDLPDGTYCPKTLAAVEGFKGRNLFDSAARVAHWPDDLVPFDFTDLRQVIWSHGKGGKPLTAHRVPGDVAVDSGYLRLAVAPGEPETVYFGRKNSLQILTGVNPFGRWLICGMRP